MAFPLTAFMALCAAVIAATSAQAQVDASQPGRLAASSFGGVPADQPVIVRPLDDSPNQVKLKDAFATALQSRGWRLNERIAALALNFETEVQQIGRRAAEPSFGRMSSGNARETEFAVNVYSNTRDSIVTGRQQVELRGSLRYVLTATLDDQRTGRRLWQGEASWEGVASDEQAILRAMVPMLADAIGKSVRQRSFSLN